MVQLLWSQSHMKQRIQKAIDHALAYITSQQRRDGGLESFSSPTEHPFQPQHTYRTILTPALVLSALASCDKPAALRIRNELARFILSQKSPHWSYNYWTRSSKQAQTLPYPDDLDDTFCALSALWLHDPSLISKSGLANMTKILVAAESQAGGPYHTWLVPADAPETWQDIDIAVNANVAFFLSLAVRPLPNLTSFMAQTISQGNLTSRYYPNEFPIIYFMARAHQEESSQAQLITRLVSVGRDGYWNTPLHTALAVTSLLRLGHSDVASGVQHLLEVQNKDGSWDAAAFCIDPQQDGRRYYSGSPTLTTALAIEALLAFQKVASPTANYVKKRASIASALPYAYRGLTGLNKNMRLAAQQRLANVASSRNGQEIMGLARRFYESLRERPNLTGDLFIDLSVANLYGWAAYTIYDNILDGDESPDSLPIANVLWRRSLMAFQRATDSPSFKEKVGIVFDTVDNANHLEVTSARFAVQNNTITIGELPTYQRLDSLAERSLGHVLPPLGVLTSIGTLPNSQPAQAIEAAIRHYIIAKQLNDDIHDWRADLDAGRVTYVVARLLRRATIEPGPHSVASLTAKLEQVFWYQVLPATCRTISQHTSLSRKALINSNLFDSSTFLDEQLSAIDHSIADTYTTITETKQFLRAFGSSKTDNLTNI